MSEHAASSDSNASGGHGHGFAHPMPVWQLLAVFFALIILTIATVYQATLDLGSMELVASLVIATIKASLVILFFMHMIHDKPLNAIFFLSSFIFVALFLGFTLMDAHGSGYQDKIELKVLDSQRAVAPADPSAEAGNEAPSDGEGGGEIT
ncbi:MAG: cytochrome C oxidase subunit IV family protein [Planctomycetota bacterium]|nr:cytochrome C oxidase subunit IV family protein [Planctomycetota bacterium]